MSNQEPRIQLLQQQQQQQRQQLWGWAPEEEEEEIAGEVQDWCGVRDKALPGAGAHSCQTFNGQHFYCSNFLSVLRSCS